MRSSERPRLLAMAGGRPLLEPQPWPRNA
ncbi:hypothetical protein CABS02_13232 [Colletotrichum abscissum]|uniref:Uncharacterized protein n=1 Tax=Colletotrichum abscissum TaxID=1671311 RepID=A0A9P9X3K9_9PEZI|nr:hypothetical protein CABS02_13232 [Colletotrichum abscissum]